jgi:signal transduction histidine kinase/ligand-binding sensor domain-containing protein
VDSTDQCAPAAAAAGVEASRAPRPAACIAILALGPMLALPWAGMAAGADAPRWAPRAAPVFRLVASRTGEDAGVPYTGSPGAFAQDRTGFIWNGTDVGLERSDGYRMRTYVAHPGDPCALPADYVVALHVDDGGRLWVSTFGGGLAYYEPETDCIRTVGGGANDLAQSPVTSFADDAQGGLWLGSTAGLLHLAPDPAQVARLSEDASEQGHLSHMRIACVLRDRRGALWVGSERGLERRAPEQMRFEPVALPPGAKVRALLQSSDGRIWVGTVANGAYVIDQPSGRIQEIDDIQRRKPIPSIWRAAETPGGEIWLGTTGAGIIRVDPASLRARALHHQKGVATSLPDNAVIDIMRDRRGLMWVATDSGLGFFNVRDDVSTILVDDENDGIGEGLVKAMARMADGRLAIGVGTEIALIGPEDADAELVSLDPLSPPSSLVSLASPNARELFAAAQPYGLLWIDRTARRTEVVPLPGPDTSRHVIALVMDGERLFAGGTEGVWLVERRAGNAASPMPWLTSRRFDLRDVWGMARGPGATLWAGTVKGLYRLSLSSGEPSHVRLVGAAGDPIVDPHIKSLHTDRMGRLWIGTNSEGLFIVLPPADGAGAARVLRHLTAELPSGAVSSILEDDRGTVWVGTDRGISRIDANSFAVGRLTRGDGIAISSYESGSCAEESCNELMFGGLNGITLVRPDRPGRAREPPPVVITRIAVGRDEVPSSRFNMGVNDQGLTVPADAHRVSVEFAALDYADPLHYRYESRLEDNDRDWVPTGNEARMAMYTNLAPGTYHLRLRAADTAGEWPPQERQLLVRVAAAWYQTMWFHALEAFGIALAGLLIVQARTVVLRVRQRELEALVVERTQSLVRETKARNTLIENLAHDLRTPLTSLRGYLETLRFKDVTVADGERSRYVAIAVRQVERLNRLIRELFDLVRLDDARTRLGLERFSPAELVQDVVQEFASIADGRTIAFEADPPAEAARIVGDINLVQRMIDNLVDNAVQHTPAGGKITVKLAADGDQVVLQVCDTGRGIEAADLERIFNRYERGDTTGRTSGAGLGLAIVKRIVELHDGSITVDSEVGAGTRFTVRLPMSGPDPRRGEG